MKNKVYLNKDFFEFVVPRTFYNKVKKSEFIAILKDNYVNKLTLIGENKRKYSKSL